MPSLAVFALVALPWLNPFAPGPSAAAVPLLVSWMCAGLLCLLARPASAARRLPRPGVGIVLALGLTLWLASLRTPALPGVDAAGALAWPTAESLALGMALLVTGTCAWRFAAATPHEVALPARAWLAAGLASAVMGWMQYNGATAAFWPWVSGARLGEAFGNLHQRNLYASLTGIALCALVWLARQDPWFQRPARVAGPAALLAAGNALSVSRTGFFELLLLLALAWGWGLWRERAVRWTLGPVLPAYLATALGVPLLTGIAPAADLLTRLTEGATPCSSRVTLWSNMLTLIGQRPWSGWGWGQLDAAHYLTLYDGPRFCDILDNAHNLPLHLAVELGLPVAVAVCGTVAWAVWRARPWRERDAVRQLAWSVLAMMALHSLLEYPLWYGPFQMALGMALGLLWRARAVSDIPAAPRSGPGRGFSRLGAGLGLAILAATGLAAWDYQRVSQIYLPPDERSAAFGNDALATARQSWLFTEQARFAELTMTPLTAANAEWTHATAAALLRFSPEPRVLDPLIESAVLLGRGDGEAVWHLARYRAAFPANHAKWAAALRPSGPASGASGVGR